METYVARRQKTVTHYIAAKPIMDLCLADERLPGTRVSKRWREQEGLDMEGMRMTDWQSEREKREGGGTDREADGIKTDMDY